MARFGLTASQPSRFMDLPAELSLLIFQIVFTSLSFEASDRELRSATALLYSNRQIRSEAAPVFLTYWQHFLRVLSSMHRDRVWNLNSYRFRSCRVFKLRVQEEGQKTETIREGHVETIKIAKAIAMEISGPENDVVEVRSSVEEILETKMLENDS